MQNTTKSKKKLTPDEWGILFFILAFLFGSWLRVTPLLSAGFPINDGGMFYVMIENLLNNGYILPALTNYNQLSIPYAYSPLPFYLAAALFDLFHIPLTQLLMWIPAVVSTLCILVTYKLAKTLTQNTLKAGVTALLYALTPGATMWLLMGGGLTRSLGMLFLLLMTDSAVSLFRDKDQKKLIPTIVWGSLTVLSHPEMTIHAIGLGIFITVFHFSLKNLLTSIKVGFGVILLTSPWWGAVIHYHGITPFLQAPQTGYYNFLWVVQQVGLLQMATEQFLTIVSILGVIGFALLISRKEYLIPLFLLVPYIDNPRNAGLFAIVPLCIGAAVTFIDVLLPTFTNLTKEKEANPTIVARFLIGYFLVILLLGGYYQMDDFSSAHLPTSNREALLWVKENTPQDASFLIINGSTHPFFDPLLEWFPALAERYSVSTIQGLEWTKGGNFFQYMQNVMDVQQCYFQNLDCLQQKAALLPKHTYLLIAKNCAGQPECNQTDTKQTNSLFLTLKMDAEFYTPVFENNNLVVYIKR